MLGRLRELPRFSLCVVEVVNGSSGCAKPKLKTSVALPGLLEDSGRGLRQPRSHVLSDWRLFSEFEAERLGFVVGIFRGNRSLVGSFAGGSAVTARHAACRDAILPQRLALKEERGGNGAGYRSPFLSSFPSIRSLLERATLLHILPVLSSLPVTPPFRRGTGFQWRARAPGWVPMSMARSLGGSAVGCSLA